MLGDRTKRKLLERNVNMDYNFKVKNVAGIYEELRRKKKLEYHICKRWYKLMCKIVTLEN